MPPRYRPFRTLLLLLLLGLSACATGARRGGGAQIVDEQPTTVRVENQNWLDMNIFVLRGPGGGTRVRLGTVPGASTRVFTIPRSLVFGATTLRFLADPVGSQRTPISNEITVREGDELRLTIPNY